MTTQPEKFYMGIDVSKKFLDIYILPSKEGMQFQNNPDGIKKLKKKLLSFSSVSIVMEATDGYEKRVALSLLKAGLVVSVCNPRQIRDFAKALGKLAKTDVLDAEVIALFAEKIQPVTRVKDNESQQKIAEYNVRRRQLIKMLNMEKIALIKRISLPKNPFNALLGRLKSSCSILTKYFKNVFWRM